MSLYKDASLVMIPTAYKDGKLYSIRPVPEYGSETIINGSFDADSDWSKGTGWTISGGTASCDGTQTGTTNLNNTAGNGLLNGKTYRVVYTISGYAGGSISIKLGNTGYGVYHSANGTYTQDLVAGVTTFPTAQLNADANFIGSIDNVSVQEIVSSGDFDFSRGSNLAATRVDVNGLIEKGRENLLPYSNDLNGSDWSATRLFSTTNGHSGYDGSNDAWLVIPNSSNNTHYANQVITSGNGVQTISVYAKASGYDYFSIRDGSASDTYGLFDLATQTTSTDGSNAIESKMVSVGNDWYRCSLTLNRTAGGSNNLIFYVNNVYSNKPAYVGDEVSGVYFQDFQLEQGLVATDYIETTTTTAQAGILEDMPRLDYSGSCPSLKLEPQRTNLVAQSEYFGASWSASNITITSNATTSPEGVNNATLLANTSGSNYLVYSASVSASSTYQFSFYAKNVDATNVDVLFYDASNNAIISTTAYEGDLTTEWKRLDFSVTTPVGCTSLGVNILYSLSGSLYAYGAQLEAGSYSTSYIPCMGTSQTRSLDVCDLNGMNAAGISTSNNWTYFIDVDDLEAGTNGFYLYSTSGEILHLFATSVGYRNISNGTTYVASWSWSPYDGNNSRIKMIFRHDGNKLVAFINGVKKDEIDSSLLSSRFADPFDRDRFHWSGLSKWDTNQKAFFDTALTDSECIALTTI
jgi:hypothetical protein